MGNINFRQQAINSGYSLEKGFKNVGFVLENLGLNQKAYCCIYNCNKWLDNNFGITFNVFIQNITAPCVPLKFARYAIADSTAFEGHLIATSKETLKSISKATRSKRYYYITEIKDLLYGNPIEAARMLEDPNIIKFCRSSDFIKTIKEFYPSDKIKILDKEVPDFDIDQILEIINGR